ncbi:MAG: hypothetical protein JO157_05715 [Acetobacteraceae bacterium]|nr:hypothetical protein [Acetobacteraceae bacterium]
MQHRTVSTAFTLGLLAALPSTAGAAERFFAYNETTSSTFTGVYLAPAGTTQWGANQALNDKDKELDPSERLPLKGVSHERYDVRLVNEKGKACVKRGVDLAGDTSFVIRDEDLRGCTP